MKIKTFLTTTFFTLILFSVNAQEIFVEDSLMATPREISDSLLSQLDLSSLQKGILLDKAYPFIEVKNYTGSVNTDTLRNQYNYNALYAALYTAQLPNITTLNDGWVDEAIGYESSGTIPFRGLHINYEASIEDKQLLQQLITFDGAYFRDVPGRTQSPWEAKACFAASSAFQAPYR